MARAGATGLVTSAHDLADGGLAQALVESCLRRNVGARVHLPEGQTEFVNLFSESASRALVSVPRGHEKAFLALCTEHGVPVTLLGATAADPVLEIEHLFGIALDELRDAWTATLPALFGAGAAAAAAAPESADGPVGTVSAPASIAGGLPADLDTVDDSGSEAARAGGAAATMAATAAEVAEADPGVALDGGAVTTDLPSIVEAASAASEPPPSTAPESASAAAPARATAKVPDAAPESGTPESGTPESGTPAEAGAPGETAASRNATTDGVADADVADIGVADAGVADAGGEAPASVAEALDGPPRDGAPADEPTAGPRYPDGGEAGPAAKS
jgi:phosphoribosylformylglycinamidine synthase